MDNAPNKSKLKKNFIIFFLLIFHLQSYCQKSFTASVPCSDSLILSIKGKYTQEILTNMGYFSSVPATAAIEMKNRLRTVHQLVEKAIPEPMGLEAKWKMMGGNYRFANDAENERGFPTYHAAYICSFFYYDCWGDDPNFVAYSGETSIWINVDFNGANAAKEYNSNINFTINGLPVYQRYPAMEKWNGYDLLHAPGPPNSQGNSRYILIHRKGVEPYLPVTRKQYLEYFFKWADQFYDLKAMKADSSVEAENFEAFKKSKADNIKRYEKELKETREKGLSDAPAIVFEWYPVIEDQPIFTTEAEGGGMLVIENSDYFRKDLPKYMPQLIWMKWRWNDNIAGNHFRKMLEANFPIEKLQAMIDK